jgi:maltoporin
MNKNVLNKSNLLGLTPLAAALLMATASLSAQAIDYGNGLEINNGYVRGGFSTAPTFLPRSGYQLGGDAQHYRLGNEGDQVMEFLITEKINAGDGVTWKFGYMPAIYNGVVQTNQLYAEMTGLDIAPEAKFWGGQRRLRIQDVHIVDHFFMDYGVNQGAGMLDKDLGGVAKLGIGIFSSASDDNHNAYLNSANRLNFDISEIKTNSGGVLRILTTAVSGDFKYGPQGYMVSLSHNQSNFLVEGLNNTLFLQTSSGHASLDGGFYGLGDGTTAWHSGVSAPTTQSAGAKQTRITDSITWQAGNFGGQALASVANSAPQGTGLANDGVNTQDVSVGGRVSYAVTNNFKLLLEAGATSRATDGQATQSLNKVTIAPTLAAAKGFWARPELRFYVTQAQWNDAAATANNSALNTTTGLEGFGYGGRKSATIMGVQMEGWF